MPHVDSAAISFGLIRHMVAGRERSYSAIGSACSFASLATSGFCGPLTRAISLPPLKKSTCGIASPFVEKSAETEPGAPSGESAAEKSVDAATQDLEPATVEETGMSSEPEPVAAVEVNDAGVDAEEDEAMQLHDDESLDEDPSDAEPKETE